MRKSFVVILFIMALVIVPITICAQGLPLLGQGYHQRFFITGAWVHSFNTHYSIDEGDGITFAERTGDWSYNYDAFQVGLGLPIAVGDQGRYGTLLLGGTIGLPSSAQGEELFTNGASVTLHGRKWSADTFYSTLEGHWAYPIGGAFFALGGFRWVSWQTTYKHPFDTIGGSLGTDTADVTVNVYQPFLGILTNTGGLTVGVVGFPTAFGDVEHKESFLGSTSRIKCDGDFDKGYFAEIFVEHTVPSFESPSLSMALSVFGKVSFLRTTGTVKLNSIAAGVSQDYDFGLHRNLFFLGAKATLEFDLPEWPISSIFYR